MCACTTPCCSCSQRLALVLQVLEAPGTKEDFSSPPPPSPPPPPVNRQTLYRGCTRAAAEDSVVEGGGCEGKIGDRSEESCSSFLQSQTQTLTQTETRQTQTKTQTKTQSHVQTQTQTQTKSQTQRSPQEEAYSRLYRPSHALLVPWTAPGARPLTDGWRGARQC
ncbi:unnamed protein product [Gadus morhua 'NCC']